MRGSMLFRAVVITLVLARPVRAQTIADLFDDNVLQEIRVTMSPADWQSLHEKYLDSTYYPCHFEWRSISLDNVGVRSRGSGTRNPIKPSFGFDFSRYASSQRFLTLKSLVTRNFAQDPSNMREWLTMKLFHRMGLSSQRESFARITVNGEYAGIFLLVEPIDKRYLLTRFGEDSGYLYEGKFTDPPYQFEYLGDDPARYLPNLFEPKTHEDQPEGERLVELVRAVNHVSESDFVPVVGRLLDLDQFVSHLGVEQYVAEVDGFLGYAGMTNYYLYRRMSDNRFVIIPWDKDNAFAIVERSIWANAAGNVLTRRVLANPGLRQRYMETVAHAAEIAGGASGWLAQERARGYALIRPSVLEDPVRVYPKDGSWVIYPMSVFEEHQQYLQAWLSQRNPFVGAELMTGGFQTNPRAPDYCGDAVRNLGAGHETTTVTPGALARLELTSSLPGQRQATSWPLPLELDGVTVTLAGRRVPIASFSPLDVVFQVPWDVTFGSHPLDLAVAGQSGHGINVDVRPGRWATLAVTHADWRLVTEAAPAIPGEALVMFGTGLAHPSADMKDGLPAGTAMVIKTTDKVAVLAGKRMAGVWFAGWTPGCIGLSQLVITLPADLEIGPVPLVVFINDEPAPAQTIPVR